MHQAVKRATWFAAATLGLSLALSGGAVAAPAKKDAKPAPEAPLKANAALKEKIKALSADPEGAGVPEKMERARDDAKDLRRLVEEASTLPGCDGAMRAFQSFDRVTR